MINIFAYAAGLLYLYISFVAAQTACNGDPSLCLKSYGAISFAGAHDSFAVQGTSSSNQNFAVDIQLKDGIRFLQGQGHNGTNGVELCHSDCALLDGGTLTAYLQKVKTFLDANPNEVITFIWSNQGVNIAEWAQSYVAAGLDQLSYVPTGTDISQWPTLQAMITAGKRVVSFIDTGADPTTVPYILDEFTYVFETPFDQTSQTFPCTLDRPAGGTPNGKLYVMNHFLDVALLGIASILVPDVAHLNETNSADPSVVGSLAAQGSACLAFAGRNPNFVLVDYYDQPNNQAPVLSYVAQLNGYTYVPPSGGIGNGTIFNGTTVYTAKGSSSSASTITRASLALFITAFVAIFFA